MILPAYCPKCGLRHRDVPFPRKCVGCHHVTYLGPTTVVVCIVPIASGALVIGSSPIKAVLAERRGIEPDKGKLAMPSGYVDLGEMWQVAACRELREEVGLNFRMDQVSLEDVMSVEKSTLIFVRFPILKEEDLTNLNFQPNEEVQELMLVSNPTDLVWATHQRIARRTITARA